MYCKLINCKLTIAFVFRKSISNYNSDRKANDLGHITLDLKADILLLLLKYIYMPACVKAFTIHIDFGHVVSSYSVYDEKKWFP